MSCPRLRSRPLAAVRSVRPADVVTSPPTTATHERDGVGATLPEELVAPLLELAEHQRRHRSLGDRPVHHRDVREMLVAVVVRMLVIMCVPHAQVGRREDGSPPRARPWSPAWPPPTRRCHRRCRAAPLPGRPRRSPPRSREQAGSGCSRDRGSAGHGLVAATRVTEVGERRVVPRWCRSFRPSSTPAAPSGVNVGSTSGMCQPGDGTQLDRHDVVADPAPVREAGGVTGREDPGCSGSPPAGSPR